MSTINGTSGNDNLNGGSADDLMLAGAGNDMLSGGSGNDAMHGEAGADKLVGGSGNDVLDGGSGSDSLAGDAGNDTLVYTLSDNLPGGALDVYTGGSGTDTVMLQLSDAQWQDPSVRAVLQGYVAFLASVARSGQGEVSNGVASDYVLDFGGGTRLTVQMSEKLSVAVQSSAGGAYVTIDHTAALIGGVGTGSTVEAGGVANGNAGTATATGDLSSDDLDGPDDLFQVVAAGTPTAHGYGNYAVSASGVWTFTLNNSHPSVQELNAGGTLTETFKVKAVDGTEKLVTVAIGGANDAAIITGNAGGSVVEAGGVANGSAGTPTVGGNLYADDVDNPDDTFQAVAAGAVTASGYGSYGVNTAGQWTYALNDAHAAVQALNVGDSLNDSFTVKSQDGTSQVVTVTIAGRNDAAVISGAGSGAVIEAGGVANGLTATPTAAGDLSADDVDNADDLFQPVPAGTASTSGYGSWGVDAAGQWNYTLDNTHAAVQALNLGQSLSDSFSVTSVDGTTQVVTISIAGRNDAAVITGQSSGAVIEAGGVANGGLGTAATGGNLYAADVDNPNDTFQAVAAGAATAGGYGSYGINAAGQWTYALND
ncbi:VCBS domain-containing protein, partial [Aquabacterium sp.]|uniref:VCBS domain-containing protein n=1 Tax=Aquabacterium sp. TaxID=1872578 RepID=UPI002BBDA676